MDYFGDGTGISPVTGKPFGVNIEYFVENRPLGNAGALFELKSKLTEDFLLLNADVIMDVDFRRLIEHHTKKAGLATIFTHPNNHPQDSGLIFIDEKGSVAKWLAKEDKRPQWYQNRVNAGIHVLSPKLLDMQRETEKVDLDRQILKPLAGSGQLFVYRDYTHLSDLGSFMTAYLWYAVITEQTDGCNPGTAPRQYSPTHFWHSRRLYRWGSYRRYPSLAERAFPPAGSSW